MSEIVKGEKVAKNRPPTEIFDFELETKVQCQECKGVKFSSNKQNQLNLRAPVADNVEKGTPVNFN
jgi:uncharacterized UBP type Zn finger protein